MGMSMTRSHLTINKHYASKVMADEGRRQTIDSAIVAMNAKLEKDAEKFAKLQKIGASKVDWWCSLRAFLVCNLGEVYRQHQRWTKHLPRVTPHYGELLCLPQVPVLTLLAVKCNPEDEVVKLLARLGTSFDCASMSEIEQVLKHGVDPSKIIYAHPRKCYAQASCAVDCGVVQMTTDSVQDLENAAEYFPSAELIIRIATDDADAKCQLSDKFGASYPCETKELLQVAKENNLNIVGVSFHVGSDASKPEAFQKALKDARDVFDQAASLGYDCKILDIGGGFTHDLFEEQAECVNKGLKRYFYSVDDLTILGEPGRFYVGSAYVLAARVTGLKKSRVSGPDKPFDYVVDVNDGVYGTLQNLISDHQQRTPKFLRKKNPSNHPTKYKIYGPTCDSYDLIGTHKMSGLISCGDWLYFEDMGAYTVSCASKFNGMNLADTIYIPSQ